MSKIILGIDEVGRGPWAGPLVVGAVILGTNFLHSETTHDAWLTLDDSKRLTTSQRTILNQVILDNAASTGLGWVPAAEIDRFGLSASLKLATRRAVKQILTCKIPFDEIIIDGTVNFLSNTPLEDRVSTLKKADHLIKEVSAASIIAKVARDQYMVNLAKQYPSYGFEKHVGYGTAQHRAALTEYGPCPEHRYSFRPISSLNTTDCGRSSKTRLATSHAELSGQKAEQATKNYLLTHGHSIIAQNYRTKTYEIDLITTHQRTIYFTEVKYSRTQLHEGTPLVRITPIKRQQMAFAATAFIAAHPELKNYSPQLAVAAVSGDNFQVETWFPLT